MNEPSGPPPRINRAVNIKALPLEPEEAFVYSRIDGRSDANDIALTTGLALERVEKALVRLGALGALEGPTGVPPVVLDAVALNAGDTSFVGLPDIDMSETEQRSVFRLWKSLPNLDHYELLGLARDATRNQIKEAYFEKVAAFHPDKHFGKRLGPYKEKLEIVFQRLTLANDTLGRSLRREEYDASLPPALTSIPPSVPAATHERTPGSGRVLSSAQPCSPARPSGPPVSPTLIPRHAPIPTIPSAQGPSLPPEKPPVPSARPSSPVPSARPGMVAIPSVPPRAVVHGLSTPPTRIATPSLPPVSADQRRQIAAHSITRGLRHLGTKGLESLRPRLSPKPAAQTPSSPPSNRSISLEQAQVAAERAEWERAGALFAKVAAEQKDGHLFGRAAECYAHVPRHSGADSLRRAVDCARQAVSLAPNNVQFRLSLSRLYAEAGLMKSAWGEAERAQELSPGDKKVQSWVQHLKQRDAGALG